MHRRFLPGVGISDDAGHDKGETAGGIGAVDDFFHRQRRGGFPIVVDEVELGSAVCAERRRLPRLFRRNGVGEIVHLIAALHNIHGLADPFVADGDALTDPPVAAVLLPVA